mgnify:CR=1 FL=1
MEVEEGVRVRISAQTFPISQYAQELALRSRSRSTPAHTPYLLVSPGASGGHEIPQRAAIGKLGGDHQVVLLVLCRENSLGGPVALPLQQVCVYQRLW